jgi:threonine synthase
VKPYNFERLLFYLTGQNHDLVNKWMSTMEATSKLDLDDSWHKKLMTDFMSARITDDEMCSSMKKVYDELGYCIDPHTAVAVAAADKMDYDLYNTNYNGKPYAILSTASPCKFEESVTIGIGPIKWNEYRKSNFPSRAVSVLERDEIEPFLYKWLEGQTLDEVEKEWEQLARNLILEHFS